ncbi:MAG TPA: hypothetical protein VHG93_19260 [Longimicrobium sp.]|nr:hypothetical protein [Longimicrobium sp.]
MRQILKLLVGVAAVGVVVAAFRDSSRQRWLRPALPGADDDEGGDYALGGQEPVLGYDGMDRDTLLDWLREADLDRATLLRIQAYETASLARGPVLDAIEDMLG